MSRKELLTRCIVIAFAIPALVAVNTFAFLYVVVFDFSWANDFRK